MKILKNYVLAVFVCAAFGILPCPSQEQKAKNDKPEVWTLTFLKAKPGQKERLFEFLEKNWLVIDRIAVERNLIKQYRLVRGANADNQDWDAVVAVEYKNERRYDDIKTEFEEIRSKHRTVLIDNLGFKDLGEIVKTQTSAAFDEKELLAKTNYARLIENWRAQREADLKGENGWLTLVGLFWLDVGANTVGSDEKNAVVLPSGGGAIAARVGTINFDGAAARLSLRNDLQAQADGKPFNGEIELKTDDGQSPTVIETGGIKFHVIKRGARFGVRVKDPNSNARREFAGLKWFPVNRDFKITARFEAYPEPKEISVPNVLGDENKLKSPGLLIFQIGGKEFRLSPVIEGNKLFIIFRDATARAETYQAGRFLYADLPKNGAVVLDFNRAENPPCAFTAFATCPLPPSQNRLEIEIPVGEKRNH